MTVASATEHGTQRDDPPSCNSSSTRLFISQQTKAGALLYPSRKSAYGERMLMLLFSEKAGVCCLSSCSDYIARYQIIQFQVRSTAGGDDFTGRSILQPGLLAYPLDMCCKTGE